MLNALLILIELQLQESRPRDEILTRMINEIIPKAKALPGKANLAALQVLVMRSRVSRPLREVQVSVRTGESDLESLPIDIARIGRFVSGNTAYMGTG